MRGRNRHRVRCGGVKCVGCGQSGSGAARAAAWAAVWAAATAVAAAAAAAVREAAILGASLFVITALGILMLDATAVGTIPGHRIVDNIKSEVQRTAVLLPFVQCARFSKNTLLKLWFYIDLGAKRRAITIVKTTP